MNTGQLVDLAHGKAMSALHGPRVAALNKALTVAAINEALHRIERMALWSFLEGETTLTSTPGQRQLDGVPGDLSRVTILYDVETERRLDYHDDRQAVLPLRTTSSVPEVYSEWNGDIKLWPEPTAEREYLLRYYAKIVEVEADEDVPGIPEMFHDLLASYAARVLILRTPAEGNRFLPDSASQPFEIEWREGLQAMMASPFTLKSLDRVPWHEHAEMVTEGFGQDW